MVLTDVNGSIAWETNTSHTDVVKAELLNSGNLVLKNPHGEILWQSDLPTDTLLPSQTFTYAKKSLSGLRNGSYASGILVYILILGPSSMMQVRVMGISTSLWQGNNQFLIYCSTSYNQVQGTHHTSLSTLLSRKKTTCGLDSTLRLVYDGLERSSPYWPNPDFDLYRNGRTNYNSSRFAILDDMGRFYSDDSLQFNAGASEHTLHNGNDSVCRSTEDEVGSTSIYDIAEKRVRWVYLYSFAVAIGAVEILFFAIGWLLFRRRGLPDTVEAEYRIISCKFRRFSYGELKKATKRFEEELGRGGSGRGGPTPLTENPDSAPGLRGRLQGGLVEERNVAVKRYGDTFQGDGEFWAEVSTIGKISHMNLVRMWGFCSEGRHRILVYVFKVAIGTAKALAYHHHECLEWIIHCNVMPENILLDTEFGPRVADFGLAKQAQRGSPGSELTCIRGTNGDCEGNSIFELGGGGRQGGGTYGGL
ncbi:hypothetical protein Acr_02g0009770 [Actinidia rufa]|uniref:Lectin protein kinase family protein n=1 Tax=Actinidia rufa TaxID=165716 RepID=A0A7J0EAQ5_9ERIC|nr:hypothetical protein Acr_02g0009770 [Actinidia rufa]